MRSKKGLIAGLAIAAIALPTISFAQATDTQNQVQTLLSQIKALQAQLMTIMGSSTAMHPFGDMGSSTRDDMHMGTSTPMRPSDALGGGQGQGKSCAAVERNIRVGSQGDDVKSLQQMLGSDPENGFDGTATGFFGPKTAKAMMNFQIRMGIASSTDGSVGPKTRDFLKKLCAPTAPMGGMNQASSTLPIRPMKGDEHGPRPPSPMDDLRHASSTLPMPPQPMMGGEHGDGPRSPAPMMAPLQGTTTPPAQPKFN